MGNDIPPAPPRPPFGRGTHALFALGFLAFAVHGSLVPYHYQPLPWDQALARWEKIPYLTLGIESRSDFVANILLFIPLGYFIPAALSVDRRAWARWAAAAVTLPALYGLANAIEFTQIFFPPRTVSQNDIYAETAGAVIGAAVWLAAGPRLTAWLRSAWTSWGEGNLVARLLPAYLAFLLVLHLMPMDLTLSPAEVYHKYKAGQIVLVPFRFPLAGWALVKKLGTCFVYFAPLGWLLSRLDWRPWRRREDWGAVLGLGLLAGAAYEFLQLFVVSRVTDVNDALADGAAVLCGWWLGRRFRLLELLGRAGPREAVLAGWLAVAALLEWWPPNFVFDLDYAAGRWHAVSLVPFADYHAGTDYNFFDQFVHKLILFAVLGAVLTLGYVGPRGRAVAASLAASALAAMVLEAGQLFLPGRFASVTDVLVMTAGGWVGAVLARRASLLARPAAAGEGWGR